MKQPVFSSAFQAQYPLLAEIFNTHWETHLHEYAALLFKKEPVSLEIELKEALGQHWLELGYSPELIASSLRDLETSPVLQTSHHITPTNGPTFLTLDLICLSGLKQQAVYLVGGSSGVAFSNNAWSGALSFGEIPWERLLRPGSSSLAQALKSQKERSLHGAKDRRLSLISARQRDQLLFGTSIEPGQLRIYNDFTPELQSLVPEPKVGELFSHWAANCSAKIQSGIFKRDKILYFDLNEVIRLYMIRILETAEQHPLRQIFTSSQIRRKILSGFAALPFFLQSYQGKKSNKVDMISLTEKSLFSNKLGEIPLSLQQIILNLKNRTYCPGLLPCFFILRFLNKIRCLGSYNQIQYLEDFRQNWLKININFELDLKPDYNLALTTGRYLPKGNPKWPLELALNKEIISKDQLRLEPMKNFWLYSLKQLSRNLI